MDNTNLLQLIMSDGVFSLELLALFAIGFYLIVAVSAYPVSPRHLAKAKMAPLRGLFLLSPRHLAKAEMAPSAPIQIGFSFATLVGVGSVLSPARTWLRQDTKNKF